MQDEVEIEKYCIGGSFVAIYARFLQAIIFFSDAQTVPLLQSYS